MLAGKNEKISKSKGNAGKSPEELIEQYSADAVRYWACGSSLGKDTVLDEKEILKGRKLVNKIWNVLNLVKLMIRESDLEAITKEKVELTEIDKFLYLRIQDAQEKMSQRLEKYDFG